MGGGGRTAGAIVRAVAVDIARDGKGAQPGAPTLDDAQRAADALSFLDPGLVLAYGSVVDGTAHCDSDVDLMVVFDDLGDYRQRSILRCRATEAAESVIGRPVDVRVTDRPEWKARTECVSSFERHIASWAITLRERRVGQVDWQKEITIPPTDEGMARASLGDLAQALEALTNALAPYAQEAEAADLGDRAQEAVSRARRLRRVCALSQEAMETGLKALNHALPGPHPPRTHDLGALIDLLPVTPGERDRLGAAVRDLDLAAAAQWRQMGTYPGDFEAEAVAERSTPEHAATMVNAAARLTFAVVDLLEDRLGDADAGREVRDQLSRLVGLPAPEPHDRSRPDPRHPQALPELTPADMHRRSRSGPWSRRLGGS